MLKSNLKDRALLMVFAIAALFIFGGCQRMESSEYGVVFRELPRFMLGGIKSHVLKPGEMEFLWPWEKLYRLDTSVQTIAWGGVGKGDHPDVEDYVQTRSLDGNEVGLAITIQYHLDPEQVSYVLQNVATDNAGVQRLIEAVSRTDIRTHMNTLKTAEFFNPEDRQHALERVKQALNVRLLPEGIIIDDVTYTDHRFERRLLDGSIDRSYQEQIDRTQSTSQETEQEQKKVKTVIEKKKRELNDTQARVNRMVEEAGGYKRQAILRSDGYLEAKRNEAEQVKALGFAEVEGLKKQIEALSGPGGEALLRLSLMKALLAGHPQFVVVNSGKGGKLGLDLNHLDTNELLKQAGILSKKAWEKPQEREQKDMMQNKPAPTDLPKNTAEPGTAEK